MILLIAALFALVLGPLLYRLARTRSAMMSTLDGFLIVAIGGLVLLDIIPASFQLAGWLAILFALVGFVGPGMIEISFEPAARQAHRFAMLLALVSLTLHALLDGVALAVGEHQASQALPLAVVLHRIPVALTIWWLLQPRFGAGVAGGVLAVEALATIGGFAAGAWISDTLLGPGLGCFQALVAGSLFHVVVHRSEFVKHQGGLPQSAANRGPWLALGGVLGAVVLLLTWVSSI